MDVTYARGDDGDVEVDLGPDWSGFTDTLRDAVTARPPRGSAETSLSTYWIDRVLREIERPGEDRPIQGGNESTLSLRGGQVVATSDYELFDPESLPVDVVVAILTGWREQVVAVRDREAPQIAETYRRAPYPD